MVVAFVLTRTWFMRINTETCATEARRDVSHGTTTQAYLLQSVEEAEREALRRARG